MFPPCYAWNPCLCGLATSVLHLAIQMFLRRATESDLNAITDIALAALPMDPQWPYRFPYSGHFPQDHYVCTRIRYKEYLDNVARGVFTIVLAEAPSREDVTVTKPIAFAIWQMPGFHIKGSDGYSQICECKETLSDVFSSSIVLWQ